MCFIWYNTYVLNDWLAAKKSNICQSCKSSQSSFWSGDWWLSFCPIFRAWMFPTAQHPKLPETPAPLRATVIRGWCPVVASNPPRFVQQVAYLCEGLLYWSCGVLCSVFWVTLWISGFWLSLKPTAGRISASQLQLHWQPLLFSSIHHE